VREGRRVKVDILLPVKAKLWIPRVFSSDTCLIEGIPVTPLFDLIIIKIHGWKAHRASHRADFLAKRAADISDVRALLDQALAEGISYEDERPHHGRSFMERSLILALSFIEICGCRSKFQALGFPV
jgi:hypothetical protein